MALPLSPRQPAKVPVAGLVISIILSLISITILTLFLTQRALVIKAWSRLPFVVWLVFAIYIDSYLFVLATAILEHSLGVNTSLSICQAAIILCLVFYVTTKLIYLFLVEKAFTIRGGSKPRLKSKLYIFNSFGMLGVYCVVVALNFVFRITEMRDGMCIIGMRSIAMIPLISFDAVVNVYLTILFLIPFKNLYSFKHMPRTKANIRLRTVAMKTFVGSLCTLVSSIVNLTVLMALQGEPGWVCLMCCNCDILFSSVIVQWVTSKDNAGTQNSSASSRDPERHREHLSGHIRPLSPSGPRQTPPSTVTDISLVAKTDSHGTGECVFDDDDDSFDSPHHGKAATSVMVTTTIRHESAPRDIELDYVTRIPMRSDTLGPRGPAAMPTVGPAGRDRQYMTSHTSIRAGPESLNIRDEED